MDSFCEFIDVIMLYNFLALGSHFLNYFQHLDIGINNAIDKMAKSERVRDREKKLVFRECAA